MMQFGTYENLENHLLSKNFFVKSAERQNEYHGKDFTIFPKIIHIIIEMRSFKIKLQEGKTWYRENRR